MAVTYTWTIQTCERDIATGGINVIHWRCTGVDGEHSASNYGSVGLTYDPSDSDFIAYADVTEAQAQAWVWENVSQTDTEAAIAADIDKQINPTEASGNPWAA
jgi:hypothetical protein